jgi:cytochrome c
VEITEKYKGDTKGIQGLVKKVKEGGVGVWGQQPMPAHGMHTDDEIKSMIDAILKTQKAGGHKK